MNAPFVCFECGRRTALATRVPLPPPNGHLYHIICARCVAKDLARFKQAIEVGYIPKPRRIMSYFTDSLGFHEHRWSYHLRKSAFPLVATLYGAALAGLRLPEWTVWYYVLLTLALNGIGKVWDHFYYHRREWNWRDAIGDLLIIAMLPVPAFIWCITGNSRAGLGFTLLWCACYAALAMLGWSDEKSA